MMLPIPAQEQQRMAPLFNCHQCGMQIERSISSYWRNKGRLLCSGCRDRLDSNRVGNLKKEDARSQDKTF